jgi:hypothetical protein
LQHYQRSQNTQLKLKSSAYEVVFYTMNVVLEEIIISVEFGKLINAKA